MMKPKRFRESVKLVKLKTNDGLFEMLESKTFVGQEYYIDPASRRMQTFFDPAEKSSYMVEIVEIWDEAMGRSSVLPIELLDI